MSIVRREYLLYIFLLQYIYLRANCKKPANGKLKTAAAAAVEAAATAVCCKNENENLIWLSTGLVAF